MAETVYVEIPKRVGDYRVQTGELDLTGAASVVGDVLGFIPGVGNTLEKTADFLGRFFTSIFGTQKDEVRDVTRKILGQFFGAAFPGKVTFTGSAGDVPVLPNQYREADIRRALEEIGRVVLAELKPGSDIHGDLSLAFRSFQFNRRDTAGGYLVLKFQADPTAGQPTAPIGGDGYYGASDPSPRYQPEPQPADAEPPNNRTTVEPGKPGGISPVLLGVAVVVGLILVSR